MTETTTWLDRDIKRLQLVGVGLGVGLGIPLGWVTLPFILWAFGATMEFHW